MASSSIITSIQRTSRSIFANQTASLTNSVQKLSAVIATGSSFSPSESSTNARRAYTTSSVVRKKAWDPSLEQYKYWNREESKKGEGEI